MSSDGTSKPYKPSWINRFVDWLHGLPPPTWVTVLVLFLLLGLQAQFVNWLGGVDPWGRINPLNFLYQLFTVEVLFFMKYLDRDAARALRVFRSLLDLPEQELSGFKRRLTTLPARPVLLLTLVGFMLGGGFYASVAAYLGRDPSLSLLDLYGSLGFGIPLALALIFCYRIIVQLRTVNQLYGKASRLDLYNLDPVYALSSHTAKTGVILLLMVYSSLLVDPAAIQNPTAFIATVIVSLAGLAAFVLPLGGINRRLVAEKRSHLSQIRGRLKDAFATVERKYDGSALGEMGELGSAIENLERQLAFVQAIPTWPWQPGTMRGFLSAMLLPIVIWIIQQLLARMITS